MNCDVAIVGAGPAGLFAAHELADSNLEVLVIDKGKAPLERDSTTCGVGGAGAFSDGKLNLTSNIGGDPSSFDRTNKEVEEVIEKVDEIFTTLGVEEDYSGENGSHLKSLKKRASRFGVEFVTGRQRHIGTDKLPEIMNRLYKNLEEKGIDFLLDTKVKEVRKGDRFVLRTEKEDIKSKYLVLAPGRAGSYWLREQAEKMGVDYNYGPIDVGVRVEFPSEIYEDIKDVMYDAKFRLYTKTYDDFVRTFCTNPNGFISIEKYENLVLVNGHAAKGSKSENTNLAILSRIELTDPVEDTTKYGRAIAKLANTIGGGKPLLQRLKDLRKGRRSNWSRIENNSIVPTLKNVTPGDISMALPNRVVNNIIEGLDRIDNLIPGIASGNTLVYAPEIKFYDTKYRVDKNMETSVNWFYVVGDASGHSRGIVFSVVMGIFSAKNIKKKED